ncbi:hemoglobin [Flavisolibacter sp. BT320]|nr:hemoglobin [Flavisolibacter longurius]
MKEQQIILVKKSWRIFRQIDPRLVGGVFYEKLFADQPSLRRLFKISLDEQSQQLIDMLSGIVFHLDDLEGLQDDIRALALRHVQYGVKPEHYTAVGAAMLWTLQQGLGQDWNQETAEAWQTCYDLLSATMIGAAYSSV